MPSASNVKPEKQAQAEASSSESSNSNNSQQNTPIRQAIVIIEHKIRNLDKRKAKLETYRELQRAGKDLNQDQKVAVAKYDEVSQTLEFARDLCKQFHNIVTISEKEAKKLARKEELARRQQDLAKIREVLLIQDVLSQMGAETIREDFLLGRNGATQISADDLQLLDDLYPIVSPKHLSESDEGRPEYSVQVQQAADHLLGVVDGRQKEFSGSTFAHVKQIIESIHSCGYLEKPIVIEPTVEEWNAAPNESQAQPSLEQNYTPEVHQSMDQQQRIPEQQMPPMPNFPPVPEQMVQQSVVSVVEPHQQAYFQPPPPQMRPINEMLETGSFYFLQESELDSPPEMIPPHPQINPAAPIPSQTFTNQNFATSVPPPNAVPAALNAFTTANPNLPPPPIPMPPSHHNAASAHQPAFKGDKKASVASATFNAPQEFDNYSKKEIEPKNIGLVDSHKNGNNDWANEQPEERPNNRPPARGNNSGNRNRSSGGYYQNNYYQNNGYSGNSGGYKSRSGGGNSGAGNHRNQSGGTRSSGNSKGPGQYSRNKLSAQH